MGRKCKCTVCKADLNTDTAYLWIHKTEKTEKRFYFCSEEEFIKCATEKALAASRKNRVHEAINDILGYEHKNSMIFKCEAEWSKDEDVVQAIESHVSYMNELMFYKGFCIDSDAFRVYKYLSTVINNNLNAWVSEIQLQNKCDDIIDKRVIERSDYKPKSHQKRTRKCLDDYD